MLARLTFQHNLISGIRQARAILWDKHADPPIFVLLRVVALATMAAPIAMVAFAGGSGRLLRANKSLVPLSFDSHQLVVRARLGDPTIVHDRNHVRILGHKERS